jgi:hypothetical protein
MKLSFDMIVGSRTSLVIWMHMKEGLWLLHPSRRSLWQLWSFLPVLRLIRFTFLAFPSRCRLREKRHLSCMRSSPKQRGARTHLAVWGLNAYWY